MVPSDSVSKAGPYSTDGEQTDFPFSFYALSASHVTVYLDDALCVSGFSVTLLGDEGGTVIFETAPEAGHTITILRAVPINQLTDIQNHTEFLPEIIEDALDKLTMICQELNEVEKRAVVLAPNIIIPEGKTATEVFVDDIGNNKATIQQIQADLTEIWGRIRTLEAALEQAEMGAYDGPWKCKDHYIMQDGVQKRICMVRVKDSYIYTPLGAFRGSSESFPVWDEGVEITKSMFGSDGNCYICWKLTCSSGGSVTMVREQLTTLPANMVGESVSYVLIAILEGEFDEETGDLLDYTIHQECFGNPTLLWVEACE